MEQIMNGLNIIMNIERLLNNPIYNEQWRQVNGYANYYVSNCGRVKNIKTEKILTSHISTTGYICIDLYKNNKRTKYRMHRLVSDTFLANLNHFKCVDHIDGNRTNNLVTNLRWCTHSQNQGNRMKQSNLSSIFKGVYFHKQNMNWIAEITIKGKKIHLGCYKTQIEAGKAYNKKAIELFGEFAKLNII